MRRLELAERVIELRERAGLTQGEAAKRAGVGVTTWSNIETGSITRPHARTVIKIARGLGVEPEDLIAPKTQAPLSLEPEPPAERGYLSLTRQLEDWRYLIESTAERHIQNASSNLFDTTEGASAYSIAAYTEIAQLFEIYLERLSPTISNTLPESLAELEAGRLARSVFRLEEAQEAISKAAKAAGIDLDHTQGLSEEELAVIDEAVKEYEALPELDRRRQDREAWKIVDRLAETSIASARELRDTMTNQSSA